jgi:hypothetical protein
VQLKRVLLLCCGILLQTPLAYGFQVAPHSHLYLHGQRRRLGRQIRLVCDLYARYFLNHPHCTSSTANWL